MTNRLQNCFMASNAILFVPQPIQSVLGENY